MAKSSRRNAVAIMQEYTQGTARTSSASDFILVEGIPSIEVKAELIKRDPARPYFDPISSLVGKRSATVKFKIELKGGGGSNGASLTAFGPMTAALEAVGLTGAVVGANCVFYPTSSAFSSSYYGPGKSVTIEVYKEQYKNVLTGALGSVKFSGENGKLAFAEFEFNGGYNEPTEAALPTTSPNVTIPPVVQTSALSIMGYSPVASKFEIDIANDVTMRDDLNSAAGLLGFQITDCKPKGTLDPEAPTIAAHNVFNKLVAGTTGSFTMTVGSTPGNIINFYAPSVQYTDAKFGDRSGLLTFDTPIQFNGLTGNDFIRITFQ